MCTLLKGTALLLGIVLMVSCDEQLPSQTGSISVTSAPSGARIFLNQSDTGRVTPYVISDLSIGSHSIHLTLAGHSDWGPQNVPVAVGQITTVNATMERIDPSEPDVPSEQGLGLKRLDVQAYQSAHIIRADPVALPSSADLSVDAPIPGNQGSQGSCVGWAVAYAVKTYQERIERGWPLTEDRHVMSPAYVYNQIKVPGGGAYFVDAFTLLVEQGVSSWEQMPYDPLNDRTQPSSRARAEAANYKIADWGTVLRNTHAVFVKEIKRHLVAGDPVLIGVPVYPDFDNLSESNPVYDDEVGPSRGAHAIVIVGYDDRRSAFKIANSWGTDWGIGGYGWIDYAASESLIWMAYVTRDEVASFDDEQPDAASDPRPGTAATGVAVDTVLRWTRNERTTSFDVYLGVDPHLSAVDFQGSVARAEFAPHLAPGAVYYWRIDARGAGGITQGPVWSFTTAGTLEEPGEAVNPSPADGATGVAQSTELRWDSGGQTTSYDVYLGVDPVLGASELQQRQGTRTYSPTGLRAETRYYWRIDARGAGGITQGPVWSFTTAGTLEESGKAVNPSPADGATGVAQSTELRWDSGGRTTSYDVYLGIDPVLGASELQGTQGTRTYSPTGLRAGTRYYWRIDAKNGQGTTRGDVWTFITVEDIQPIVESVGDRWRKVPFRGSGLNGVAWSGSRFVAVDGSRIWHSADGITWRSHINPIGGGWAVAWNGKRFIVAGSDGITYSPDGITWKVARSWEFLGPDYYSISAIAGNGTQTVAVGSFDREYAIAIMYSPDGISWSDATIPDIPGPTEIEVGGILLEKKASQLREVTTNGSRFVAGGEVIYLDRRGYMASKEWMTYSDDGIRWSTGVFLEDQELVLTWGNNRFVASGYHHIWYSRDGITWSTANTRPRNIGAFGLRGMMWNGERFIGWNFDGYAHIWHSVDGISWTMATIEDQEEGSGINAIAGDGTRLVAVTSTGTILTSP